MGGRKRSVCVVRLRAPAAINQKREEEIKSTKPAKLQMQPVNEWLVAWRQRIIWPASEWVGGTCSDDHAVIMTASDSTLPPPPSVNPRSKESDFVTTVNRRYCFSIRMMNSSTGRNMYVPLTITITMSLIRDGQTPSKSYRKKEQWVSNTIKHNKHNTINQ